MITVLRLGHRIFRDQRATTHCFLAARALGADSAVYTGQQDKELEKSIEKVAQNWGGKFGIRYEKNWQGVLKSWKGKIAHLTVYGIPFQEKMPEIKKEKNLLIIAGGEKVPPEVYKTVDWNVSVTGQPHSEIAALAIFLHEYFGGRELGKEFSGGKIKVIPQERGKKVVSK